MGVGLLLVVSFGAVAYAALGPSISLQGGSEPKTEGNGPSARSPSDQRNTTTRKGAPEQTASPSSKGSGAPEKSEDSPSGTQQTQAEDGSPARSVPVPKVAAPSKDEAEQAAGDYYRKAGLKD